MKTCSKCNQTKSRSEFSKNAKNEDGLASQCKTCTKAYLRARGLQKPEGWERKTADRRAYEKAYRLAHIEKMREYQKKRPKRPYDPVKERAKYERLMLRKNPNWKPHVPVVPRTNAQKKAQKKASNPVVFNARHTLDMAVSRGRVKKHPCFVCGVEPAEGHHPDYSRPREVVWLCREHHGQLHEEFKEIV